jgi:1-deoxy-D-xylulose-5-phosphate synthase
VTDVLRDAQVATPVKVFGIPRAFLDHGKREDILLALGLTDQQVSRGIIEWVAATPHQATPEPTRSQVPGTAAP